MKTRYTFPECAERSVLDEFILGCDIMAEIMAVIRQVALYDVNVLLAGESGTGKEMLAKIIHLQSPRAEHPFIPVNCGILSGMMFEDKLFGHEKGAFTGAVEQKIGCFESAHRGTLFLDEVAELPLDNQIDFLRVLEDFRFMRIGGNEMIEVDVRVISATNKDLKGEIKKGLFREDLFYRLQVIPIYLPPLRDRRNAIPGMVSHFLNQFEALYNKPKPVLHPEVIDLFVRYDWPGNVRELKNMMERIFIISTNKTIHVDDLPPDFLWHFRESTETMDLAEVRKKAETGAILEALHRARGDREKASRMLGISPRTLRHKVQKYDIRIDRIGGTFPDP
ncbi:MULTISPECIES: sigma-54 interaction domain-containing protein [Desulfococcus]|uniref:Sigma54 specific transcriptional regulator, Fis family n=1 Tax=Desulfococcus multivorans DSM 2059 TaxID=1121405 RepID=S7TPQ9_DESML|nr:sigma-54 dependent transcriptional regulator [Desulfococcus multivorans]AOY57843.1 transcriptional regulator, sigma54-dependent [Desulfococcus multivorans]AQV00224.1 sigma-54-dependent Fis family transcriptional regulator [Desulfococcus multivorans]EPR38926.1 sigma54 specific transcriptional regulator, Fis family [Desulfococcus multivorans DSM 2059]SJZ67245.1 regulatory protein, Fis family [Desulfococcus multivorans DSM 2059]